MSAAIDWHGRRRQPCPECGKGPRDTALSVTHDERGAVAHCFRCGYVETMQGTARPGIAKAAPQAAQRHEVLSPYGRELWDACRPLAGEARAYLEARACVIPPADGDLRWHPALKHPPSGMVGPALVGLLTDAIDGTPRTLHRTWVMPSGHKAPVDPPRMLLGGHRKAGAVCRLWPDEAVTMGLGTAEGVETALSLAHAFRPVWAAIDAGNVSAFPVLEGIESIVIAADFDPAGIRAARECARRWADAGREARVILPDAFGADLNDMAQGGAHAGR